ncbi:hypothetical protein SALBM311S_08795 [Streptomyces alboniger]
MKKGLFLNDEPDSYTYTNSTIEASDVFAKSDGQTRSKHYSKRRATTWHYDYIGWLPAASACGSCAATTRRPPAARSTARCCATRARTAGLYEILYYGQNQTEDQRFGLQGPYVIAFTDGGAPSSSLYPDPDHLLGRLARHLRVRLGASGRGRVAGVGITGTGTA